MDDGDALSRPVAPTLWSSVLEFNSWMQAQKGDGCSKSVEETTPEVTSAIGAGLFDESSHPETLELPSQSDEIGSSETGSQAQQTREIPLPGSQEYDKNIFDPFLPDLNAEMDAPISTEDALNFCGWDSNVFNLPEEFTVDARGLVDPGCNLILW